MSSILTRFNGTNVITDDDLVRKKIDVPWISSMHRGFRSATVHGEPWRRFIGLGKAVLIASK